MQELTVLGCYSQGWSTLRRNPIQLIGAGPLFSAIGLIVEAIPVFGILLANWVVVPVLSIGYCFLSDDPRCGL